MKIDQDIEKYVDVSEIKCRCGSSIVLTYECRSKETGASTQILVKCSNDKSPKDVVCGCTGMIWKNELIYMWD